MTQPIWQLIAWILLLSILEISLPCWTRSAPSFAPPGGVRETGAERLLLLSYWMRYTSGLLYDHTTEPAADFGPGPEAVAEERAVISGICFYFGPGPEAAAKACTAGLGICFLRLSLPTSGLARRRRRRGAQLGGEFALYASRYQLRAWP